MSRPCSDQGERNLFPIDCGIPIESDSGKVWLVPSGSPFSFAYSFYPSTKATIATGIRVSSTGRTLKFPGAYYGACR